MSGYEFHPDVEFDLKDIWEFIAEESPTAADKVAADIRSRIERLVPFPNQGHKRPDLTSRLLRFAVVHQYSIAYAPERKPLWIVAVVHGRRNPQVIAAILRGRALM